MKCSSVCNLLEYLLTKCANTGSCKIEIPLKKDIAEKFLKKEELLPLNDTYVTLPFKSHQELDRFGARVLGTFELQFSVDILLLQNFGIILIFYFNHHRSCILDTCR